MLRPAKPAPTDPPLWWRRTSRPYLRPLCSSNLRGQPGRRRLVASLKDYERKRNRGEDAGAVRGHEARKRRRSRSSSCSATTRGGSTTTSGSSATARSRAGRCRRASRSSRASSTSPSTSRTTRSTYATFEGEIPAGNYGAGTVEIWDHGTYELVEEKPNGGLTVRLHGERLDGHVGARPGAALGRPEELADRSQARGGGRGAARQGRQPAVVRADARDARRVGPVAATTGCTR